MADVVRCSRLAGSLNGWLCHGVTHENELVRFVSLICHLEGGKCGTDAEINEDRFVKKRRRLFLAQTYITALDMKPQFSVTINN